MIKNKRILITGGAGFIGAALTQKLYKTNKILIVDNLRRNSLRYFPLVIASPSTTLRINSTKQSSIEIAVLDILNKDALSKKVAEFTPDIVLHLAAMAGVSGYYAYPVKTMEVNAIGTYNLLSAVKDRKLERFVYFSTSEVYGPMVFGTKESYNTTQGELKQIRWTYGISKLAGEGFVFAYSLEYNIPVTSIRPFNIYGPGQVGEGAVQIFARLAIQNKPIKVTGHGNQIRAWCYIDDCVSGILSILEKKEAVNEIFNIGDPAGTITILQLAKQIIKLSRSKSKISFIPHIGVDIDLRIPNITKAEKLLGYRPQTDLKTGLKKAIAWYKKTKITEPL